MQRASARLSQRIAQEAQLLAEEKWIIDALRTIKQQRNCLQIEKLHLENLRATVDNKELRKRLTTDNTQAIPQTTVPEPAPAPAPAPSEAPVQVPPPEENRFVTTLSKFDVPVAGIDDEMCNNEQLDLSVTGSVFTNQQFNGLDLEEDDDDLDQGLDDEEDMENALIEMNMLMQAKP